MSDTTSTQGTVWLVGAGPGDPELLTLKAARLLKQADVVLYDSLVSDQVLDMIAPQSKRVHVGKRCGAHRLPQARINALLHRYAGRYRTVVRLKGGDPFIFGRGGEEMMYLRERNVPVEIVPGITAAAGCAAATQIPLTHRDYGDALTVQSGHSKQGRFGPTRDYTRVFYMGLNQAGAIREALINDGIDPAMPVAIILAGTTREQAVIRGELDQLADLAAGRAGDQPGLIIVGRATALARSEGAGENISGQAVA
jgi:uroporphyrin-III C-methyltransferase